MAQRSAAGDEDPAWAATRAMPADLVYRPVEPAHHRVEVAPQRLPAGPVKLIAENRSVFMEASRSSPNVPV